MAPGTSSGAASNQGSPSVAGSNDAGSASNMGNSGQSSSSQLSTSTSGQLSKQQAIRYIANFAMVDKNSDGNISETEFQDGCKKGWVQAASSGSGQSGSSSSKSGG
jgi:hypothetical protein